MTQAPKALLFDIMDTVVVDPFFDDDFGALFGLQREALYAKMTPDVWLAFERGELSADAYYAQFFRDGSGVDGALLEDWMATRYRWMPGMEALLSDLRDAGVPVYALSNYPVWWKMIERRLGLSAYLEWRFVSCMTGVRKPDPRSYLGPAEALALAPASLWTTEKGTAPQRGTSACSPIALRLRPHCELRCAPVGSLSKPEEKAHGSQFLGVPLDD
mgnify:CR=1 FL=1